MTARVDLFISNDRHHRAMTWPVAEILAAGRGCRCRVLSLCELRGRRSPTGADAPPGVEVRPVLPFHLRRSPSIGRASGTGGARLRRRAARALAWRLLIGPRLAALLGVRPALAVLPNDAAYPFDRVADRLHRIGVPFLLLQEGIRFPLPAERQGAVYGAGGAAAVAAWGAASGEHFRQAGVPAERIHLTGSPRFDALRPATDPDDLRRHCERLGLPGAPLTLISNPIDDQGFCSHGEKMELFARFLAEIEPLFVDPTLHLAVKLHGRENAADFLARIPPSLGRRVWVLEGVDLADLLHASRAAIVMASTVGVEALLCGLPLGVLEIPGYGFQYDYVQSGIAAGLSWRSPMAPQVASLLEPSEDRQRHVEEYLGRQLAVRGTASRAVAELIRDMLAGDR